MSALEPTYLESPAQISGQELRSAYEGLQEGVVGSGDLKVTAAGGTREVSVAAGVALIQGDAITDQGLYRARNDAAVSSNTATAGAFESGGIEAADATNPRIDQIVARVYDTTHDASGLRKWRLEVVKGTATGGATLDNRSGAAALPGGAIRLADVLLPAGATTVIAGNIRDRRPWARGAYRRRTSTTAVDPGTSYGTVDAAGLAISLECSGVPMRLRFRAEGRLDTIDGQGMVQLRTDGAAPSPDHRWTWEGNRSSPSQIEIDVERVVTPAAGWHTFAPYAQETVGGAFQINPTALEAQFEAFEIVRQNAENS